MQSPNIKNETGAKPAKRAPHVPLDKISVNQNVMLQIEDKEANADLTVIPVEINMHFYATSRPGHQMKYGRT